ncbi:MAG TPA: methylated-DNA--[protein]-cysteine S-methyltransferase [Rhodanobacteraceae bacterium]|nr:methylated-DNA--[protein]-cysteine S-methyltransferase [Rhodanobacteraceae bacterium]
MITYGYLESPLGTLLLARNDAGICQLTFQHHKHPRPVQSDWQRDDGAFADARAELAEYFAGHRRAFDLPLSLPGTAFQKQVWNALLEVPYGQTITYAQLAERIGRPGSYHPVGAAVGMNPVSIFVPCHRALGSDGSLTGYAGGIERKVELLRLEGQLLA